MKITERFGNFSFLSRDKPKDLVKVKTGFEGLDRVLGGGIPQSAILEIFGWESVGKTTLGLQFADNISKQKQGLTLWLDFDHNLSFPFVQKIIGHTEFLYLSPNTIKEAIKILGNFTDINEISCIVIDSVVNLITEREQGFAIGSSLDKITCFELIKFIRKIRSQFPEVILICINQLRTVVLDEIKIDFTPVGLSPIADIRIEIVCKAINETGMQSIFYIRKNKFFIPDQKIEMNFIWDKGFVEFCSR